MQTPAPPSDEVRRFLLEEMGWRVEWISPAEFRRLYPDVKTPSLDTLVADVLAGHHVTRTLEIVRHVYFPGMTEREVRRELAAWAKKAGIRCTIVPRQTGPVMVDWVELEKM